MLWLFKNILIETGVHWFHKMRFICVAFVYHIRLKDDNTIYLFEENSEKFLVEWWLAENMEFVDDILTFGELGLFLKSHGCHVVMLSSLDFSVKNGIAGCLRALLREFLVNGVNVSASMYLLMFNWFYLSFNESFTFFPFICYLLAVSWYIKLSFMV